MHSRKNSHQVGGLKKFIPKKYSSRAEFLDFSAVVKDKDIYTNSRENNVLYDIYSNTANSGTKKNMFFGKKKKKQLLLEKEDLESSRM